MDGRRFDDATRALATGVSRRSVLRGLIGGAMGGMLALAKQREGLTSPRCKAIGKRCKTTADCCPDQNDTYCAADLTCQACAAGTTLCRGECVAECGTGTVMDATTCGCVCPSGATACDGACVDPQFDEQHCGGCGERCTVPGSICADGRCVCPLGTTYCNGACVVDACAVAGQTFSPRTCQCECPAGTTACGGACVSTACELGEAVIDPLTCQCVCETGSMPCGDQCMAACGFGEVFIQANCTCKACSELNGVCEVASDCGTGGAVDTCQNGCCCVSAGSEALGCAPGSPAPSCCSGMCGSNGRCA